VPLSARAVEIIEEQRKTRTSDIIFPGERDGQPLSSMTMAMVLREMPPGVTTHGFSSSFRDFCAERARVPSSVAEQALAHKNRDATEAAYLRSDLFEMRQEPITPSRAGGLKGNRQRRL
jgi:integrase